MSVAARMMEIRAGDFHQFQALLEFGLWPIATEIHVSWHVGNQDKSGLVVLNVSFVARDPLRHVLMSMRPHDCQGTQAGRVMTQSLSCEALI